MNLRGLCTIAPTPFLANGSIDEQSIYRLMKFYRDKGVHGVTILGIMGEVHKLSESERHRVMEAYIDAAGKDLPIVVGCSAQGTDVCVDLAKAAEKAGAVAVMVAPPSGLKNYDLLFEHYAAVAKAIDIPLVVQDEPVSTGVVLSPSFIARLVKELHNVNYVKVEEPPTPPKVTSILQMTDGRIDVFGGLGGLYSYEELLRGAVGMMTGFAYPEVLVQVYEAFTSGEREKARRIFYRYLPLIRFEAQLGIGGVAIRKETFRLRGVIQSSHVRKPSLPIDTQTVQELKDLVRYLRLDT